MSARVWDRLSPDMLAVMSSPRGYRRSRSTTAPAISGGRISLLIVQGALPWPGPRAVSQRRRGVFMGKRLTRRQHEYRGRDSNPRPSGYGPDELPGCSTPGRAGFPSKARAAEARTTGEPHPIHDGGIPEGSPCFRMCGASEDRIAQEPGFPASLGDGPPSRRPSDRTSGGHAGHGLNLARAEALKTPLHEGLFGRTRQKSGRLFGVTPFGTKGRSRLSRASLGRRPAREVPRAVGRKSCGSR
jgi:hypothetical protein